MDYVKTSPQYSYAYPEFIFLFNTGVRIGELAGLTWDNVDFKNNMLTIDKTVNRYRKKTSALLWRWLLRKAEHQSERFR